MISRTFSSASRYCLINQFLFPLRIRIANLRHNSRYVLFDIVYHPQFIIINKIMKRASCGLDINFPNEICGALISASENGFEFVCLPLVHPRFKREFTAKWKDRPGPFTRPDLVLKSSEWNSLVAGKISPYLNIDSQLLNGQAKFALEQELNYGSHLDVPAIIIPLRSGKCYNLARIINSNLSGLKPYQVWVEVPLVSYIKEASVWRSDLSKEELEESTWKWWNNFHTLCNSDKRLGVILIVSKTLPEQKELERWMGEPIKSLVISTSAFLTNKKGYPVLSKALQAFVKSLVPIDVQVIIKGNNHHYSLDCYQKYIDHLWQEASVQQNSNLDDISSVENSDQSSLQPFVDNMSKTYEIFKRDSVKYMSYTKALYQAIVDLVIDEDKITKALNIMVVGAGRGPLVIASLVAAAKANRKVKIYAVEKNPHSIVTLQAYQEEFWHDSVEIIFEDIRCLEFPQKIDILLSESLGSFGDDELLPEILDVAQKFLKKGGISIPESYVSHICPVQGSKVYSDLKANKDKSLCEVPYVVVHKNKYNISSIKSLFFFHHPNYSDSTDNSRYKSLTFKVDQNCILHGFTGFFETILYKDVKLSTVPDSQTPGLHCWNPIFFPLVEPVHLKTGDNLEVHFWRIVGKTSVWYEWTITNPIPLPVHNPSGRSANMSFG